MTINKRIGAAFLFLMVSTGVSDPQAGAEENRDRSQPQLVMQAGHTFDLLDFALSSDAKVAATLGRSDTVLGLWDVERGRQYGACDISEEDEADSVVIANDNAILADKSGTLSQWSLNDCTKGTTVEISRERLVHPVVVPQSGLLLTAAGDQMLLLRESDLSKVVEVEVSPSNGASITSLAASGDGTLVAVGSSDGNISLWALELGAFTKSASVPTGEEVRSLQFGGNQLFSILGERSIHTWTVDRGLLRSGDVISPKRIRRLSGGLSLRPGNRVLEFDAIGDDIEESDIVVLWSIDTNRESSRVPGTRPHRCPSSCEAARIVRNSVEIAFPASDTRSLVGRVDPVRALDFHPQLPLLATGGKSGEAYVWDLEGGRVHRMPTDKPYSIGSVAFSPDGNLLAAGSSNGATNIWRWLEAAPMTEIRDSDSVQAIAFSQDSSQLAVGYETSLRISSTIKGRHETYKIPDVPSTMRVLRLDGNRLLTAGSEFVREWEVAKIPRLLRSDVIRAGVACCISISGRGDRIAATNEGLDDKIHIYETQTLHELPNLVSPAHDAVLSALRFGADDETILAAAGSHIYLWSLKEGLVKKDLRNPHSSSVEQLALSSGKNYLASSSVGDAVKLTDLRSGRVMTLSQSTGGAWISVSDSDQLFDTNSFDRLEGLSWRFPDMPKHALPVEIFMRDYYQPQLLERLLRGEAMKPVRPLGNLNRVQPLVEVSKIDWEDRAGGLAKVTVKLKSNRDLEMRNGKTSTDPYDLRVFRDGQLVGWTPKSSVDWQLAPAPTGAKADEEDLVRWREKTHVALESDGSKELTFSVQVPRRKDLKEITFTAYAFNEDRVKSATATKKMPMPTALKSRQGKAYVISVGVNRTESSPAWDLQYAVNDARRMSDVVKEKLDATRQFAQVVPVRLVSDEAPQRKVNELPASKAYLEAVLDVLAGRKPNAKVKAEVLKIASIEKAAPEDLVLISVSSHGYTDERGIFHFVLHDVDQLQQVTPALNQETLNTDQLSAWLREVDAGELVLIVDACQSEATIQTEGFKPGPMGSRGLGQLAYDKGMRVLAASKAKESAIERGGNIKNGLLSYALAEEGLKQGLADWQPKDRKITIAEWLGYAEKRVPELFAEGDVKGTIQLKGALDGRRDGYLGANQTPPRYQQPVLFDFSKSQRGVVLAGR